MRIRRSDLAPSLASRPRATAAAPPPHPAAPAGAVPSVNAPRGHGRGECAEPAPQTSAYLLYSRATPRKTPHMQHGPTAAQLNYGATRAVPTEPPPPNVAERLAAAAAARRAAPCRAALHLTGAAPRRVQSRPETTPRAAVARLWPVDEQRRRRARDSARSEGRGRRHGRRAGGAGRSVGQACAARGAAVWEASGARRWSLGDPRARRRPRRQAAREHEGRRDPASLVLATEERG